MWSGMVDGSTRRCELVHRFPRGYRRSRERRRRAVEGERNAQRDLLAGDELLEIDVNDAALERVALDLADQRRGDLAADGELDDGAAGDLREELLDVAGVERQRLRLAAVAVDDGGDFAGWRSLRAMPLPRLGAGGRAE